MHNLKNETPDIVKINYLNNMIDNEIPPTSDGEYIESYLNELYTSDIEGGKGKSKSPNPSNKSASPKSTTDITNLRKLNQITSIFPQSNKTPVKFTSSLSNLQNVNAINEELKIVNKKLEKLDGKLKKLNNHY